MGNHIFISYSRKDSKFAEDLKKKLEAANVEVWTDKSRLVPGEDWQEGIDQAIKDSFALITVMTPTAKASQYVTYEWAFAQGINKGTAAVSPIHPEVKIIPILLEPTSLHPRLNKLHYFDFTDYTKQPWNELTNLIVKSIPENIPSVILSATTMLNSGSKGDRDDAINTLVESNHPVAFGILIWNLNRHDLGTVRQTIARALEQIGDAAVPALIEVLGDQRPEVRQGAAKLLEQIGDAAVPALIKALDDQRSEVRQAVAGALERIGDVAAVPALIKALDDQRSEVRQAVAGALERIGDVAAVPALIKALNDQQPTVRRGAAEALGRIGDPAAVPALNKARDDLCPPVRWGAAEALGRIRDPAVVPALNKARGDQRSSVRQRAAEALKWIKDPRRFV